MLKVILVNLIFFGLIETQFESSKEYDLICEKDDYSLLDENFLSWKGSGYNSYKDINVINMKLDNQFYEDHKQQINEIINPISPLKVDPESINCRINLNKTIGFVPKKTIYSYSYPMLMMGEDQELYGVILERKSFEIDNEEWIKVFRMQQDTWELVYENLKAFS